MVIKGTAVNFKKLIVCGRRHTCKYFITMVKAPLRLTLEIPHGPELCHVHL